MDQQELSRYLHGMSTKGWKVFGAHPVAERGKKGVRFTVYAPGAKKVDLICASSQWKPLPMKRSPEGVWSCFVEGLERGECYKYHITTPSGETHDRIDPFAFWSEVRPATASRVSNLDEYTWTDQEWMSHRTKNHNAPMNIYEAHAGSWRRHGDETKEKTTFYTYQELAEEMIPYLKQMGYTHLELMPLTEYPFDGSWGYQVSGYFAPTSRYGEPKDLMAFIDACHQAGIGVILDFVPLHFVRDFYALHIYDGTFLYESKNEIDRYTQWGTALFDYSKSHVLSFMKSSLDYWLTMFHVDGIRYDAVANLIYRDGIKERGPNESGLWFLKNTNFTLQHEHPTAMLIAEDSTSYSKVTTSPGYGGLGFDYKWDLGWMHDTLDFYATGPWVRREAYHKITFSMTYFREANYILPFSHDEVVHGKKTIIDKIYGNFDEKFRQLHTLYLYMMTYPGKKLNFMGNELAEFREWDENKAPGWNLLTYPAHEGFHRYIARLNHLYLENPALWKQDYHPEGFRWLDADNVNQVMYSFIRNDLQGNMNAVVFNGTGLKVRYCIRTGIPNCTLDELLNTDDTQFGGSGLVNPNTLRADQYGNIMIDVAPFAGILFKLTLPAAPKPVEPKAEETAPETAPAQPAEAPAEKKSAAKTTRKTASKAAPKKKTPAKKKTETK